MLSSNSDIHALATPLTDEEVEIAKKFPLTSHGLWVSAEFARDLERQLRELIPVRDILILCGEDECVAVEGYADKLRALIEALIKARRDK